MKDIKHISLLLMIVLVYGCESVPEQETAITYEEIEQKINDCEQKHGRGSLGYQMCLKIVEVTYSQQWDREDAYITTPGYGSGTGYISTPGYGSGTGYGTTVYSQDECIGAVVNGVCHGSILPKRAVHEKCYGEMLHGKCIGPQF